MKEIKREALVSNLPITIKYNKENTLVKMQKEKFTSTRFFPSIIPPVCTCRNREGDLKSEEETKILTYFIRKAMK